MALQSSGAISISDIQAELGKTVGSAATLAGGDPVQAGTLLGDATGVINKAKPYSISDWYGYANSTSFSIGSNTYGVPASACGDVTIGSLKYKAAGGSTYPQISDVLYDNGTLTTLFNGGNNWYKVIGENSVIQVNASGVVIDKEDCGQTLSASLSQSTIDESAQTVDLIITSNTSWTVSSVATWVSFSSSSGSNNATITVTATAHTGSGNRQATINVQYGLGTSSPVLTQLDIPYQTINLGYSTVSDTAACGETPTAFKSDTTSLSTATILLNFFTEEFAAAGWVSDGTLRKYWTGSTFTNTGFC